MRLYLSSFRLGDNPRSLVDLAGENRRVAVIMNACDLLPDDDRRMRLEGEYEALRELGFDPEEIDLRDYPDGDNHHTDLRSRLESCGLVWVRGGNTFVLRRAMRQSGFDGIIREMLERDAIVYGGYSAGIIVLTPSLHGVELADDPHTVPEGYDPAIIWECLHILPYALAPHYRSDHPESSDIDNVVEYFIDHHMLFRALRDGQAIVVDGEREWVAA